MKKVFTLLLVATMLFSSEKKARADIWGADVVVLAQILAQNIQQLYQLYEIVHTTQQNLAIMRELNRGIHNTLGTLTTTARELEPGLYADWQSNNAFRKLQEIYGKEANSNEGQVQRSIDQGVAEAIGLNNTLYEYADKMDTVGEQIKTHANAVSAKGAQKLIAQGQGVMIHAMDQSLRAQASTLKLEAQSLALQNRKDKEQARYVEETNKTLKKSMKAKNTEYRLPRF